MKLIDRLSRMVGKSGANGLYVFRPVLNGQEWADWAAKHGVPNPIGADGLHVTVVSSATDAKIPLDCCVKVISVNGDWAPARFGFLGKDNNAFCLLFRSWELQDRNYAYMANGTTSDFQEYVPHVTFSMDAKGFDLPDAALADCPQYVVLGAEVRADRKQAEPDDLMIDDDAGVDEDEDEDAPLVIIVTAAQKAAAVEAMIAAKMASDLLDPITATALESMAHGLPVAKSAARRVAKATWAPDLLKTVLAKTESRGLAPPSQSTDKANKKPYGEVTYADPGYRNGVHRYPIDTEQHIRAAWSYIHHADDRSPYSSDQLDHIESAIIAAWKDKIDKAGPPAADQQPSSEAKKSRKVEGQIVQVTASLAKALNLKSSGVGFNEERRWVYGLASVSTVDGAEVEDLEGDFVTTKFLEDYCAGLIKTQAGGDFEHDSVYEEDPSLARNEIVGALTFSTDLQKSLGIDLGMEFLLTVTHVPEDADWEKVKKGEWMQSIAGEFYYEEVE